jgi:hypothetical protein
MVKGGVNGAEPKVIVAGLKMLSTYWSNKPLKPVPQSKPGAVITTYTAERLDPVFYDCDIHIQLN